MFDYLDILHPMSEYPFQGEFLVDKENPAVFRYDIVDRKSKQFAKLFANMQANDFSSVTIVTDDDLGANIGDYMRLQDNKMYQIQAVAQDFSTGNKEVYRFLKDAPHCDFYITLVEVQDIWQ